MTGRPGGGLRTAVGFLTRIPVGAADPAVDRAAPWFPAVGVLIGLTQGAVLVAANRLVPPWPAAVVAVAVAVAITGAFHHDGLADMADAFGGGWDVEQRLAIMKDSRLGTYGTTALALALAAELSVLASIPAGQGFRALLAAHALSRAAAVVTMARAPLAGDGLGAAYAARLGPVGAVAAALTGLAATAGALADPLTAALAVVAAATAAGLTVALAIRKIGGITGDVLGAVQVLSMLSVLLVAAAR